MAWYWWIVIWVLLGVGVWAFIAGAHDDSRFDERPMQQTHPPNKGGNKNDNKWW